MLTIDELKQLRMNDWVWLEKINRPDLSTYCTHIFIYEKIFTAKGVRTKWYSLRFADYGKTWAVYKNKEQAESENE